MNLKEEPEGRPSGFFSALARSSLSASPGCNQQIRRSIGRVFGVCIFPFQIGSFPIGLLAFRILREIQRFLFASDLCLLWLRVVFHEFPYFAPFLLVNMLILTQDIYVLLTKDIYVLYNSYSGHKCLLSASACAESVPGLRHIKRCHKQRLVHGSWSSVVNPGKGFPGELSK